MSPTVRVVASLFAGIAVGAALAAVGESAATHVVAAAQPVGTLWLNALRMTVIPLLVAALITGVASTVETASAGRLAARTVALFVLSLSAAALFAALATPALLAVWPIQPEMAAALRAGAGTESGAAPSVPGFAEAITGILPTNPFAAAAEGAMLQIVAFALIFGLAAARVPTHSRERLLGFFQAVAETMLVVVRWILWLAPVGIFVLALNVGFRGGMGAAGALLHYVVLLSVLCALVTLAMYPVAVFGAGIAISHFARAAAPPQAVAFSTQSSLASLPAMIDAAQTRLGVPVPIVSMVLPLAVSVFRITSPLANLAAAIFVAAVYGIDLAAAQLATGAAVAVATSVAIVGLPSQVNYFATVLPICLAMGLPISVLPLLLAVEVIPDLFRTVGNATADLTLTTLIGRRATAGGG